MFGFLEFVYSQKDFLKIISIYEERDKLFLGNVPEKVAIQMEHVSNGEKLIVSLRSIYSNTDSLITVTDFRPVVKSIYDVERPEGYLIPQRLTELYDWASRQNIIITSFENTSEKKVEEYFISKIDSMDFEGDIVVNPNVELREVQNRINEEEYYFIPTNQPKNNLIVIALEPKSMLGLVTYKNYEHLLNAGEYFPVLRVVNTNK